MLTKIDYTAIYTPLIKILSDKDLTPQDSKGVQMVLDIMHSTLSKEKQADETGDY